MFQDYQERDVWKRSIALSTDIYKLTFRFPDRERNGLTLQIRRASTSIADSIAEGWGRGSTEENLESLATARAALRELETYLMTARNLRLLSSDELGIVSQLVQDIGIALNRLIGALNTFEKAA